MKKGDSQRKERIITENNEEGEKYFSVEKEIDKNGIKREVEK